MTFRGGVLSEKLDPFGVDEYMLYESMCLSVSVQRIADVVTPKNFVMEIRK